MLKDQIKGNKKIKLVKIEHITSWGNIKKERNHVPTKVEGSEKDDLCFTLGIFLEVSRMIDFRTGS